MPAPAILVVDDDASVLAVIGHMLRDSYPGPIFFAATAQEAMDVWQTAVTKVDLLITDLTLDSESGEQLGAEFVRFNPAGRVVIVTGWEIDEHEARNTVGKPVTILRKPFTAAELQEIILPLTTPG
jgi:DNA-binding NtrC family response regulator